MSTTIPLPLPPPLSGSGPPLPPGGGGPPGSGPAGALVRATYDPTLVLLNSARFLQILGTYTFTGSKVMYLRCRLTRAGN